MTGVSRRAGIGFAIARRLAADGATVVVQHWEAHDAEQPWGADPIGAEGVVEALRSETAGEILALEADFADPAAPHALVAAAHGVAGHVDVLIANHARSSEQSLASLTAEEVDLTMVVNVRATLLLAQAFVARHDGRPGGRIVWFTSGQHHGPMPGELPYIASKAALHELTASVAADVEVRRKGITVNCIDPGPTDTGWADEATRAAVPTWSSPDDAARLVAWVCSDEGRWITGQTIVSDGGASLGR